MRDKLLLDGLGNGPAPRGAGQAVGGARNEHAEGRQARSSESITLLQVAQAK